MINGERLAQNRLAVSARHLELSVMCFLSGKPLNDEEKSKNDGNRKYFEDGRQWETDMCHSCCTDPPGGCCTCILGGLPISQSCCIMYLRHRALQGDMSKYQCCQGYMCRQCTEKCSSCEQSIPFVTLCCEAFCCSCFALSATRIYLQEERQIQSDPCDNRIIRFNNFIQILACICSILAIFISELREAAECINLIADIVYCMTSGCMQAQTYVELNRHATPSDY
eukprot:m.163894 g.163894  ORF g.163894 m.163894 type:complete len:225 (-) comp12353_c0_seq1:298-972(-)